MPRPALPMTSGDGFEHIQALRSYAYGSTSTLPIDVFKRYLKNPSTLSREVEFIARILIDSHPSPVPEAQIPNQQMAERIVKLSRIVEMGMQKPSESDEASYSVVMDSIDQVRLIADPVPDPPPATLEGIVFRIDNHGKM